MITVLISDDHQLFRECLASIISEEENIHVAGLAGNGFETLVLLKKKPVDILLLDISMPIMSGVEVLKKIRVQKLPVKVVMLTMYDNNNIIKSCLELNVDGYLMKHSSTEELLKCINKVYSGGKYFSNQVKDSVMESCFDIKNNASVALTDRESQVLKLVCKGRTSIEIGRELCLAVSTVESHRKNIFNKVGCKNAVELLILAQKRGLLT